MKCPYCGCDSRTQVCEKCRAEIPAEQHKETETKEPETERYTLRKKQRSE